MGNRNNGIEKGSVVNQNNEVEKEVKERTDAGNKAFFANKKDVSM
jgi:hypothetical protein